MQFSKNTLKLLKLFYAHPEQEFYIQELGRLLKIKPGVFQRTLYNLEKEGVLKSNYKANARYFGANKEYAFYKEYRTIVQKLSGAAAAVLVFIFLFSAGGMCEENKSQGTVLSSLSQAIVMSYANNKDIRIQEYGLKVADADVLGARSIFYPQVDATAGYTHNGAVLGQSLSNVLNTANTKKDLGIFTGYKNQNNAGVSVSQSVYSGGANISALRQTQLGLKEQMETLRATKLNVELDAKNYYYGLLLAYETERIARDLVEQAQSHYEQVRAKYQQGTSSKFDVLQSKVQVSLLMPQLISAQNSIELIGAELDKLIGIKVGEKITINDKLQHAPRLINEEEFLKEAYLNEPEMILKSLGIDINKWAIKYAKAGWLPQVNAGAQYNWTSNNLANMFNNRHSDWSIGFTVKLNVFDGFSTRSKVDSARAKYMQAQVSKDNLADQVAVDVKQACLDLVQAAEIIKSQEDNLADAKEALEIANVRYNNGVGINLDVLDAQVSLANVQKNLAEGIFDYLMAGARLDRAMGRSYADVSVGG